MDRAYVDTNILIRVLIGDAPLQADAARHLLAAAERGDVRLILTPVTLAEVVWVLSSFYRVSRAQIAASLGALIGAEGLEVDNPDIALASLMLYLEGQLDFVDAYLAAQAVYRGPPFVYSFDRDLDQVSGLRRLEPT